MKKTMYSITLMLCYFVSISQEIKQKVQLNFSNLSQKLQQSRTEKTSGIGNLSNSETIVSLPLLDGKFADFKMMEYLIVPENSKTDIRTYYGVKVGDALVTCRVTLTKEKLMASVIENGQTIILEKVTGSLLSDEYEVYLSPNYENECQVNTHIEKKGKISAEKAILNYSYGATLKSYKLALVITSEFYAARGNTDDAVNSEIVAIVNNLNGIYEKEAAVRFTLVSPNNPVSTNFFYKHTGNTATLIGDLFNIQTEVFSRFGSANLDIGHCLHSSGGGVAYLNGVCNSGYKAAALSGSTTSSSVLLFAHEVGHQFNADHTFNGNGSGNCSPSNRDNNSAYEPGSGNTIMSYASLCSPGAYNLIGGKVPYFHTKSLQDISSYITTGTGSTCGIATATSNTPPVVSAGLSYTIPKNTPFKLIGSGSDVNNDDITYTWEQYDLAAVSDTGKLGHKANTLGGNAVDSPTAPLFRTSQSSSPIRYFPTLTYVLNNNNNPADNVGEDLTNVGRVLNFRLTGRDNKSGGGGVHCAAVAITVDATKGPLSVTSPNTSIIIAAGASTTVTWAVNSTNSLSPNVKILLSIDGGGSFPFILSSSTSNDGSESVVIPSNVPNSTLARIIVASNNSSTAEFFDASDVNFSITSSCLVTNTLICNENQIVENQGGGNLNLNLTKFNGGIFNNGFRSIQNSNPGVSLFYTHTAANYSGCTTDGNSNSKLVLIRVTKSGNYTFSVDDINGYYSYFAVFNSSITNCSSFVASNSYLTATQFGSTYSKSIFLNECQTYYVMVYVDVNFKLNISGPGNVFEEITLPGGTSYTYAAVNQSNNLIEDVSPSSNFTNTAAGTYKIYGLMYTNGFNTNTLTGKTIEQAYGLGSCILFSNNSKPVTIIPNPCATTVELIHPTHDITTGTVTKVAASGVGGKITASNWVTGSGTRATYTARAIELKEGFVAEQGTIFRAEVGGCN
jgi:hypothetical protein